MQFLAPYVSTLCITFQARCMTSLVVVQKTKLTRVSTLALGNLEQSEDPNPFVSEYEDPERPHPSKGIENIRPTGWKRKEIL